MKKNLGLDAEAYANLAGFSSDWRDTWWNQDYLEFLAQRWSISAIQSVLDVGCGVGHWGQRLASVLASSCEITGIDHEPQFLEAARARALRLRLPQTFSYREARAETLPFPDNTFDLVTCQTVLIHVPSARAALLDMLRVLKPGGLLLVSEPSNLINAFIYRQTLPEHPHEDLLRLTVLDAACVRGKRALGQGDHTVGEHLMHLFSDLHLEGIEIRQNDRCASFHPPYETPAERLTLQHLTANQFSTTFRWGGYDTTRALFQAGGGDLSQFDTLWNLDLAWQQRSREEITQNRHSFGGGLLMYVAWGRKRTHHPSQQV